MAESSLEKQSKLLKLLPSSTLEGSVVEFLRQTSSPVAVACSGGPDSVALALLVKSLTQAPITLLHFNHRLRWLAADQDAAFVKKLAKEIGADYREGVWDKADQPHKVNEEDARLARMKFLHQWEHAAIVFGHHADDAVETFLMRLARGATLEGLCAPHAINRVRNHLHLRPLLTLRKKEIITALKACGIKYRDDRSNFGNDYLRNRIRNKLLPLWQKIETRDAVGGLLSSQKNLKKIYPGSTSTSLEEESETSLSGITLHPTTLLVGTTIFLPCGSSLSATRVSAPTIEKIKENSSPYQVWIKDTPLILRAWTPGERYTPLGAPGSRKIKELLNENCGNLSPALRAIWPIVVDSNRHPIWLPGCRITQSAAIPIEKEISTALLLSFSPPCSKVTE